MLGSLKKALRSLFSLRFVELFFAAVAILIVLYFIIFYFSIAEGWDMVIAGVLVVVACLGLIWAARNAP